MSKKITHIDGEPDLTLFCSMIRNCGFKLIYLRSCFSIIWFQAWCLWLLLNIKMPGMTGFELYRKIKSIDSKIRLFYYSTRNILGKDQTTIFLEDK